MAAKARERISQDERPVQVMLTSARVTSGFREALFSAATRSGVTVSEFALRAAGEKLASAGVHFPGIFERGDTARVSHLQKGTFLHG